MQSTVNNTHVAEERTMNFAGDQTNEEDKYGAVVRGANAYVPPGARSKSNIPAPAAAAAAANANGATNSADVPNVSVTIDAPDGSSTSVNPPSAASPAGAKVRRLLWGLVKLATDVWYRSPPTHYPRSEISSITKGIGL